MKYNIFKFDQEKVMLIKKRIINSNSVNGYKIIKLDITDLLILDVMSDFMDRGKIVDYILNGKTYYSIQYKVIIDDLPLLGIKKQALSDRINKMTELGVIEKIIVKNQSGSYTAFRLGDLYKTILYDKIYTSYIPYKDQLKDKRWKKLANKIRKRDNYTCQLCGSHEHLQVHHKKYIKDRLAWEYDEENLITLCSECHKKVHHLK